MMSRLTPRDLDNTFQSVLSETQNCASAASSVHTIPETLFPKLKIHLKRFEGVMDTN